MKKIPSTLELAWPPLKNSSGAGCCKIMWPRMAARPQARELIRSTIGFWAHPTRTVAEVRRDSRLFRALAAEAKN